MMGEEGTSSSRETEMAFERDFIERFKEDGRTALINYHKGLKQSHANMLPIVTGLMETTKPGDQRFNQHFTTLVQREEHNLMSLIGPPDRADHEIVNVPPEVAEMIYRAYAAFNAAKGEALRAAGTAPPEVLDHFGKVTHLLEGLAEAAHSATGRVGVANGLLNLAYDSILAEVDPLGYQRAMGQAVAAAH